ncbi:tumor necrosis factor receptor superfamily member 4-like [Branchiostoma floridae]|uniref:Tumor necrosis factor receptor superfamily member 4-like n=1 Tax=Branchiostoma floridae TaxID=7739 RepID=A0A9J7M8T2_BRAFL|nr:tumor necrosis factor receptor superfamily member 4-like [Branchiostoma floridae]
MELSRWPIFTLMILVSHQGLASSVECDSQHFPVDNRCCAKCPRGYYRHIDCDVEDSLAHCLPCPPGTYTEFSNYLDRCLLCERCSEDHGMEERRTCLPNQNRRCRCMKGFFLEPPQVPGRDADMCYRHQQCQPGEGVLKEGTRRSDTSCAPCAMGMFSQGGNHTCQVWTDCASQRLKEMIPGTTEHDAVCEYAPPIASSGTAPQVPPTVGSVTHPTPGSVIRMETPGKPVTQGPDEHDGQQSPSTTNPLQYGPIGKERESAGTSTNRNMKKKGNKTSLGVAVAMVGLLLIVGGSGVAAYCGYIRFRKSEKRRRGDDGVSVAYHRQGQAPEDTDTCGIVEETAAGENSAEPPPMFPTGQWPTGLPHLEWPPSSTEIPNGRQNEGDSSSSSTIVS